MMMQEIEMFIETLRQPEYLHVLLNPIPTYGTAIGTFVLVGAMLARSRPAAVAGLCVIVLSCASVWLVVRYGHQGYDRVYAMSYADAQAWLDVHEARADQCKWLFYACGLVAVGAIALPMKWPRTGTPLTLTTVVVALAAQLAGGWIAHAGGQIRHSEFRAGPPNTHVDSKLQESEEQHGP